MSTAQSWVLTDVDRETWVDEFEVSALDVVPDSNETWSVHKRTLRGGLSDGVDAITVNNGVMSFVILPTRGMGIWRGQCAGLPIGWQAPVRGPVHPKFVNLTGRGGLGWLEGFDEVIVRCGLESHGAPGRDILRDNRGQAMEMDLGLHGRIANLPAHHVELRIQPGDATEIQLRGTVDEAALFCSQLRLETVISTIAGSNRVTIFDKVTNLKSGPSEMELLYHCNFGRPFLGEGARFMAPASRVMPRDPRGAEGVAEHDVYPGPIPGFAEQVHWYELIADDDGRTVTALRDAAGSKAVALRFRPRQLPCFTLWKCPGAESDGYVTGLEPGTSLPNPRSFEREKGRVVQLQPGETYTAELSLEVLSEPNQVEGLAAEIADIQGDTQLVVEPQPNPEFSSVG